MEVNGHGVARLLAETAAGKGVVTLPELEVDAEEAYRAAVSRLTARGRWPLGPLAEVEAGMTLDEVAGASGLAVEELDSVGRGSAVPDPLTVTEVFKLPRPYTDEPLLRVVESDAGFSLIALYAVTDGELDANQLMGVRQARTMMGTINSGVESWALLRQLREQAKVEIFEENLGVSR